MWLQPGGGHDLDVVADRLVVIVVYDGVQMLDAVGPAEVFSHARPPGSRYRVVVASADGAQVRSDSGLRLGADVAVADVAGPIDTLVVAGGRDADTAAASSDLLAGLEVLRPRSRRVCSVCSGALVLGAAGWLSGRTATTHWQVAAELARRHPDVDVAPDRIFVRDGDIHTSAGVSAGMDLALALVEADHGAEVARSVARELVLFLQRPGGQSQFSEWLKHPVPTDSPLQAVVDAVVADPTADHRLARMADRARLSERHLTRLFAEHLRTSPSRFVERVRVESARQGLERSTLGIAAIAARSGFAADETMRRAFLRVLGVTPSDYRDRFRSTAPDPDLKEIV